MINQQEIDERIESLAQHLRQKGLAFSDSQARDRARDIVMNEIKAQDQFEKMKDDVALNPQQTKTDKRISPEILKQKSGGMLIGDELPDDVPLAELLKGRRQSEE